MENFEKNATYQRWATTPAGQVPLTELRTLITIFISDAEINMGSNADEQTIERCLWHAGHQYGHLPICYIASGYARGSLGDFGAGRLVPLTVKKWMDQITEDYTRAEAKAKIEELHKNQGAALDLKKYPAGQAIIEKMDWLTSGAITPEEWDRIPLKKVAVDIQAGHEYGPNYYLNC